MAIKGSLSAHEDKVKRGSSLAGRNCTGTVPHGARWCFGKVEALVSGFGMDFTVLNMNSFPFLPHTKRGWGGQGGIIFHILSPVSALFKVSSPLYQLKKASETWGIQNCPSPRAGDELAARGAAWVEVML